MMKIITLNIKNLFVSHETDLVWYTYNNSLSVKRLQVDAQNL